MNGTKISYRSAGKIVREKIGKTEGVNLLYNVRQNIPCRLPDDRNRNIQAGDDSADRRIGIDSRGPKDRNQLREPADRDRIYRPESTPQAGSGLKDPARSEIQREKHRRNRAWEHLRLHCVSRV